MAEEKLGQRDIVVLGAGAGLLALGLFLGKGAGAPGVRKSKKGGDTLVYKPTILNKGNQPVEAVIWCQMGTKTINLVWNSAHGTEAEGNFTFNPGKSEARLEVTLPLGLDIGLYDVRCEIRDPDIGERSSWRDFEGQIAVEGD